MRCATAIGTTCSFIVITTNKKQVDTKRYVVTVKLPINLFYFMHEILLEKRVRLIFELPTYITLEIACFETFISLNISEHGVFDIRFASHNFSFTNNICSHPMW
jgi:hypothetical protein